MVIQCLPGTDGFTDVREIWHGDAHWASEPDRKLKFATFKNPRMVDGRHLEKSRNHHRSLSYTGTKDNFVVHVDDA